MITGHTHELTVDGSITAMQLLSVWSECARMRGVEPRLINFPDHMHKAIQSTGPGQICRSVRHRNWKKHQNVPAYWAKDSISFCSHVLKLARDIIK